jgi:hypothetical protein
LVVVHRKPEKVIEEASFDEEEDDDSLGVANDEFDSDQLNKQQLFEDDSNSDDNELVDEEDDVQFKYRKSFSDENKKWLKPKKVRITMVDDSNCTSFSDNGTFFTPSHAQSLTQLVHVLSSDNGVFYSDIRICRRGF